MNFPHPPALERGYDDRDFAEAFAYYWSLPDEVQVERYGGARTSRLSFHDRGALLCIDGASIVARLLADKERDEVYALLKEGERDG